LYKRIISRLDIKNGNLVKGISLEGLRNLGNPDDFSNIYYDHGIDEIHFQDVVASLYNRDVLFKIIENNSKKIFVNVSAGGGIRTEKEVDNLLRIGIDKVVINSAAVKNPSFLKKLVQRYGASTIAVAIETSKIDKKYEVLIETGRERTGLDLFDWINKVQDLGVGEIIVTDIAREGKNKGFDIELFKKLRDKIFVQLIAHGGAGPLDNLVEIFKNCDVDGVSIASLFHYNYLKKQKKSKLKGNNYFLQTFDDADKKGVGIKKLKKYLSSKNIKIRL
jgi:cyclase